MDLLIYRQWQCTGFWVEFRYRNPCNLSTDFYTNLRVFVEFS